MRVEIFDQNGGKVSGDFKKVGGDYLSEPFQDRIRVYQVIKVSGAALDSGKTYKVDGNDFRVHGAPAREAGKVVTVLFRQYVVQKPHC